MSNYIPNEVKNLTANKQRIIQNVLNDIENNLRKPDHRWRYVVITAILTMSAMLFVFNGIFTEVNQQSTTEVHLELTHPTFYEEQGLLYFQGVTLGDSQSKVIERLGEKYIRDAYEDSSVADFILDYDGIARFYFYQDKLDSIVFMKINHNYFSQLFNDCDGVKFITSSSIR